MLARVFASLRRNPKAFPASLAAVSSAAAVFMLGSSLSPSSPFASPLKLLLGSRFMSAVAVAKDDEALDPDRFKPFKLESVKEITHDTHLFRFSLDHSQQKLGLNVASCLVVKAPIGENGKDVVRPYTPVSDTEQRGSLDLVIKTYPNGVMSKHIAGLKPGQTLDFKGPISKIPYKANMKKKIGMIAGGTGITPMLQVIKEILKNPSDKTEVSLLFANNTEGDIILKKELDEFAKAHKNFTVNYVVMKSGESWKGERGFVNDSMIKKYLPEPADGNIIFVCGPPGMMNHVSGDKAKDYSQGELTGLLKGLGYKSDHVFKF